MEFLVVPLFLAVVIIASSIRIIKEYQRGIVYTLGKYTGTRDAGLRLIIPFVQQMTIVDVRIRTEDIPSQDVISKDNVSVKVNAVVYYRVIHPANAVNKVEHFGHATSLLAQTTLRSVLGKHELDDMLSKRDQLSSDVQSLLDNQAEGWGIKIANVEIKDIDIDPSMIRAIAKQAEAERERRAKVINAEGELQAAEKLDQAATILAQRPETMQLRYLGTLGEFVNSPNSKTILPIPMDLLTAIGGKK